MVTLRVLSHRDHPGVRGVGTSLHQRARNIAKQTSGNARATARQQAKTIRTSLSAGTRDATEGTRSFAVVSEISGQLGIRTRMVSSYYDCKLSTLVRRSDHNWQPYMCRS